MKIQIVPCTDGSFDIVLCFKTWADANDACILANLFDGDDIEAWLEHNNARKLFMVEWL